MVGPAGTIKPQQSLVRLRQPFIVNGKGEFMGFLSRVDRFRKTPSLRKCRGQGTHHSAVLEAGQSTGLLRTRDRFGPITYTRIRTRRQQPGQVV